MLSSLPEDIWVFFCAAHKYGEICSVCVGDEPLVAVDDPFIPVFVCIGLDKGWVGTCDFGFGHCET